MEAVRKIQWAESDSWVATLANLLPLWLLSVAITAEGFPQPPVSLGLGVTAFVLAIVVSIMLLWKGWLAPDLLLVSLFPFALLIMFDEISTSYKTPFILLCALLLSIGMVGAQRSSSVTVRWLVLLLAVVATGWLASHADQNYWQMVSRLDFADCFPYTQGCAPLGGEETPWWGLLVSG